MFHLEQNDDLWKEFILSLKNRSIKKKGLYI